MSGRSGDVFRAPKRDRHGDPINLDGTPLDMLDEDGNAFVGTITDIVMGGISATKTLSRQESSNTSSMIGCPADQLRLKLGDRIVIDGDRYEVGATEWDHENSITGNAVCGTGPARYWVRIGGRVG